MFVVGVDFGTLSARAVVVSRGRRHRPRDGGARLRARRHRPALPATGERCRPSWALQDPADWLERSGRRGPAALAAAGVDPRPWSASAPTSPRPPRSRCPATGRRSARSTASRGRPHAYPKLWKHHAAQQQAERVTAVAAARGEPWLARYGGRISSEWQFAKALQVLEEDRRASTTAADRWIEAADWIVWQLCGVETRNVCAAGLQGAVPGRAATRHEAYLARARSRLRATSSVGKLELSAVAARRRAPAASRADAARTPRPPGRDRGRGRQRRRTRHRAGGARRSSPGTCSPSWARRRAT